MQVNVYLKEDTVRRIDQIARQERRSRSQVIQLFIEKMIAEDDTGLTGPGEKSKYDKFFGLWKDDETAADLIKEVREARSRNRRSEKARL